MDFYECVHVDLHTGSNVSAAGLKGAYIRLVCVLLQRGVIITHKPASSRVCRRGGSIINPRARGFAGKSVKGRDHEIQKFAMY